MNDHVQKRLRALDLNFLPILRELLYEKNVSKTAQNMHMTQPAVSEALGRLRAEFGDEILVRTGRQMVATPFAQKLIEPLDDILGKVEGLKTLQKINFPTEIIKDVVIATEDSVIFTLGKSLDNYLAKHMPKVNLQFVVPNNFDTAQLKSGAIDLAIMPREMITEDDINMLPLYREDFVGISRKGHPQMRENISPEELHKIRKVGYIANKSTNNQRLPPSPPPRSYCQKWCFSI